MFLKGLAGIGIGILAMLGGVLEYARYSALEAAGGTLAVNAVSGHVYMLAGKEGVLAVLAIFGFVMMLGGYCLMQRATQHE